jgi:uncharacterized protein
MKQTQFRRRIEEYIRQHALPPDKFSHQPRLYHLAKRLAEGKPYDDDVLHAAAWMHDLGVFIGHRPESLSKLAKWDHVAYASKEVPKLLKRLGFPRERIPAVVETIRTHLPSAKPTSFEGTMLREADILEQLGAITVLRTVSKVGRDTRFVTFTNALALLARNAKELPGQLKLKSARQLAKPRLKILREFLRAAQFEADGNEL